MHTRNSSYEVDGALLSIEAVHFVNRAGILETIFVYTGG